MKYIFMCLVVFSWLFSHAANALPTQGSCEGFPVFIKSDSKTVDAAYPFHVLREDTQVYADATGNNVVHVLPFGEHLRALQISASKETGRLQVQKYTVSRDEKPLGWVERHELLCAFHPLQLENGLERKAFINTAAAAEKPLKGAPIYKSYDKNFVCNEKKGSCLKPLGRFELYYIAAEDLENRRYLLASKSNLTRGKPLVGWLDECDMIPWNTTLQVRPKESVDKLIATPGLLSGSDLVNKMCSSNQQLIDVTKQQGITMTGGLTWYKLPYHLPILDKINDRYQLTAPGRGLAGIEGHNKLVETTDILLNRFENIDVFLLLDGTRSMQPYINKAKSFTERLVAQLKRHPDHAGAQFRFGFRVYRDSFAGHRGLGEKFNFIYAM